MFRRGRVSLLLAVFALGEANVAAAAKHSTSIEPQRIPFSGDAKHAFDVSLREFLNLGHSISEKDRDAGTIETAWEQSHHSGIALKALVGAQSERLIKIAVTIVGSEIVIMPRAQTCTRMDRDLEKTCDANDSLTTDELASVQEFADAVSRSLPHRSDPDLFSGPAPVEAPVVGPSGAHVGDNAMVVNSTGHLFSGEVVSFTDHSISLLIEKGTTVSIDVGEAKKIAIEPKATPTPGELARPTGAGPEYVETRRAGTQRVAAGEKVKVQLISGNEISGTITAVSPKGIAVDVGSGSDVVVWSKDMDAIVPW